jgi:hypothetical protein
LNRGSAKVDRIEDRLSEHDVRFDVIEPNCRSTLVELREDSTGLVTLESDNCQPPYVRITSGIAVGLPFSKTYGLSHSCTCEGPAR